MSNYFNFFPTIQYNGHTAVDITKKSSIIKSVYANPYLYYQYDVKPGERPDNIASKYYNDSYADWILYFSNQIIDPYYGWYIEPNTLNDIINTKYGSISKAQSKVKFYRNNWYKNTGFISVNQFNLLDGPLQEYYVADYGSDEAAIIPIRYSRKQIDWMTSTNAIISYNVTNGSTFLNDEIVMINFDAFTSGQGQVCFANSNMVSLHHVFGTTTGGMITGSSYLYGKESSTNTVFTSTQTMVTNIETEEQIYWEPVYYYDYEIEQNENNKSIRALNKNYSSQIQSQLKQQMKI